MRKFFLPILYDSALDNALRLLYDNPNNSYRN